MKLIKKRTKIVATIGPASNSKEIMTHLSVSGVNVFRLNFSHGSYADHLKVINTINEINEENEWNICKLQDLQGPKIRLGMMEDNVFVDKGNTFKITTEEMVGNNEMAYTSFSSIIKDVKKGDVILIDDGKIELKVDRSDKTVIYATVIHGGELKSRKGINLPNTKISTPSLTEKDYKDLLFGLENNVDWIALSFVRSAEDIISLKKIISDNGKKAKVIAKIEKPEALENIDEIISATDGIMVARGDLGVEIPMHEVPYWQKLIVEKANMAAKPVIIATQMMESMIENPRPTRAETNDIANAVMDGADALMLSGESAVGKYPIEAIQQMTSTIKMIEDKASSIYNKFYDKKLKKGMYSSDLLLRSACRLADATDAKALVCMTKSGYTGFRVSMHKPKSSIYVFTNDKTLLPQMNLVWGVKAFYFNQQNHIDDTLEKIEEELVNKEYLTKGDLFISTASMPSHWKGHTNMMKINEVE